MLTKYVHVVYIWKILEPGSLLAITTLYTLKKDVAALKCESASIKAEITGIKMRHQVYQSCFMTEFFTLSCLAVHLMDNDHEPYRAMCSRHSRWNAEFLGIKPLERLPSVEKKLPELE